MKYTFQHYMDISTSAASVTILQIKAGGEYVRRRCKHLFSTYKYFKLGKISVKLIPASTLPVDPSGLSFDSQDPQIVDPRDQLSPGLVRITNGEPVHRDLNGLDDYTIRQMYNNTMLDPRWSKFMLQSGFKRTAVPLAYDVGNLFQTAYPQSVANIPQFEDDKSLSGTALDIIHRNGTASGPSNLVIGQNTNPRGLFQLGHHKKLGWLPTDMEEWWGEKTDGKQIPELTPIPCVSCITVILPKAFKTLFYYRLFITETVYFSGIKNVGLSDNGMNEARAFDNFSFSSYPEPLLPNELRNVGQNPIRPANDGSGAL